MNVSLRALRYLVATADAGNLTEAARKLNISQPSISAAVAQIEQEFGVQIFIRHHARGVSVTPAGRRIVNEARLLIKHARDFSQSAIALGDEIRGEIAVGCFVNLASRYMPALIAGFARIHPAIELRLDEGDQQHVIESLLSGRTEVAMSYEYAMPDDIVGQTLAELPPYAILPAGHVFAERTEVGLDELAGEPFILLDLPFSRDYFLTLFRMAGVEPRISFRSRSYELIRGLVGHGRGYTIHNAISRLSTTYDGAQVLAVRLTEPVMPVRVMSLRLRNDSPRPAVQAFQKFLLKSFFREGTLSPLN
jgi:DNA-binding transcriptional LysR family regulator